MRSITRATWPIGWEFPTTFADQWQTQIQSMYSPEMQAAKAAAHQSAVDAEEQAKAEGADWKGQVGASAIGALKESPRTREPELPPSPRTTAG